VTMWHRSRHASGAAIIARMRLRVKSQPNSFQRWLAGTEKKNCDTTQPTTQMPRLFGYKQLELLKHSIQGAAQVQMEARMQLLYVCTLCSFLRISSVAFFNI
jgi:hypothetical protein